MKHFGDITKLNGAELPVVDVITGGSPCQDLSVAGKRAGLDGERSGLFMEQIRIVKEMRENDRRNKGSDIDVRPRFMVWENVPGAFSSNGGKDFQAVLTEIVRIVEPAASDVPMPPKKWLHAGCVYDELGGWSIAWRVHDAQFWGVPQRRKRIALVADFGGLAAPEVLFERKGLRGDSAESGTAGQTAAGGFIKRNFKVYENHGSDCRIKQLKHISETVSARYGTGGNNVPIVMRGNKLYRMTVMECERLQGYPDGWTDIGEWTDSKGKKHKDADAPRYKALGNSIALPFWFWLLRRISAQYERPATLGSLFDGIGGFPLCWERCNGKGMAIWASEIEEFPIAVTKRHFPEGEE